MEENLLNEYSRKKLILYANSFKELANSFGEYTYENSGRREKRVRGQQAKDSKLALKENLSEVSHILQKVAQETATYIALPERLKKKIIRLLHKERIHVKELYYIEENSTGKRMLSVTMSSEKSDGYIASDVADMLSVIMDKSWNLSLVGPGIVDSKERTFFFLEQPPFFVVSGYALAVR